MPSSREVSSSAESTFPEVPSPLRLPGRVLHVLSIVLFCVVICVSSIEAAPQQSPASAAGPDSVEGVTVQMEPVVPYEFRGDLRNLPQLPAVGGVRTRPALPVRHAPPSNRIFGTPPALEGQQAQPSDNIVLPLTPAPSPTQNFAGMSSSDSCTGGSCGGGAIPPDPNGDVGPNHYIEAVNSAYAIYNKTGALQASFTEDSLWSASGSTTTPCGNGNAAGDPIVVYDPLGDRWILAHIGSAFSGNNRTPTPPFYECIAVSKTGDPVGGGWWFYPLRMDPGGTSTPPVPPNGTFNDYPKLGIWTDCLYMSANGFDSTGAFTGAIYASISRSDLESGAALTWSLGFINNGSDPFTMIPSNLRGTPPPAGTPNYFVSESQMANTFAFEVRKFTAGPNCGGGGTLSGATNVSQASYASSPGSMNGIVPQPGTTQLLDAIDDRLMQKVQYRRVGNTESLWVVHNVVGVSGGPVQPQWAQLDITGGTIATMPVQQQIYAPDTTLNRWMGSIAADKQGNVALGYSTSNGTSPNFPSIAYSGRLATDPLNTLPQTEVQLVAGAGSQTGINRWGDYTGMSVDPSDDCTFWYVNEYYSSQANGGAGNWQTRIGSFSFPSCTNAPAATLTPSSVAFNSQLVGTTSTTSNVQLTNTGSATLNIASIALTGTDSSQFALVAPTSGTPTCPQGTSSLNAGNSCFLGVQFKPTSTASKSASVSVTDDASGSPQTVALTGVGVQPAPAVTLNPGSTPFSNQLIGTQGATTNVQLTNSGTATLNITGISLTGTDSAQFALVTPTSGSPICPQTASTLGAGNSCFLGVQFAPTTIGTKSANVSVSDDASGSPQMVSLSGTGINPAVTLSPPSLTFSQPVGSSATMNIQLSNAGTTPLSITSITLAGTDSSQFALVAPAGGSSPACSFGGSTINAGNSCFLGVQFSPTSTGAKTASVSVTDNAPGSPQTVALSGLGPAITISQTTLAFGDVNVGLASATSNIQLTNSGTAPLNITSITLTGTDPTQFLLVAPTSGSPACSQGANSIGPGNSCFLGVQFKPTGTGPRSASVSVADNASASPQATALSGLGVDFNVVAAPPTTVTVAAGTSATFTIDLTTAGGPTQTVTSFSASGNPADTSVNFSAQSIPSGTAASSTVMTITTMSRSHGWPSSRPFSSPGQPPLLLYALWCLTVGSAFWFLKGGWMKEKKLVRVCALGVALFACAAFQGCAAQTTTPSGGTPAGTSTITVTATGGSVSRTTTVILTVQ